MTTALIVVDVQNDFCEGGALAVDGGAHVAAHISTNLLPQYSLVVATRDWHIDPGPHFSTTPDFVTSWPVHCRVGTTGAQFHPAFDTSDVAEVFNKGQYSAAYSGFEGAADDGTTLAAWLRHAGVESVDVVGIATDYCVKATAIDAHRNGFQVRVRTDYTAGVAPQSTADALHQLGQLGIAVE